MNEPLFLGVDGGATSCRARIADASGAALGEGRGGRANPRFGIAEALAAILAATRQALASAGLPEEAIGGLHAGLGLAGAGQEREHAAVLAHPHPFASLTLATDADVACLGAHGGGDGAILVVGTGSCGIARVGGRTHQVGGWGFPISDHASGAWLGLKAIRQALWAHDGVIPSTPLTEAVLARFGGEPQAAVAWMDGAASRDYAELAPMVLEAAGRGDALAVGLLDEAGREAGLMIAALRAAGAERVCLMGGLAAPLAPHLDEGARGCLVQPMGDALDGALLLARNAYIERAGR